MATIPTWLRRPVADRVGRGNARRAVAAAAVPTVCEEARCPNRGVCFGEDRTATFLILGPGCSRRCAFCSVRKGPSPVDPDEPRRIAAAAAALGSQYVVVTSTTRDDLPDGGAAQFVATVETFRASAGAPRVEVLTPDFGGSRDAVRRVVEAGVAVFGHNVETVPRLYGYARAGAGYATSLDILASAASQGAITKSALLLGLGEEEREIKDTLREVRAAGVRIITIGQYLRPGPEQLPVTRYYEPAAFDVWAATARAIGFDAVAAGPFVRSSYRAGRLYDDVIARDGGHC